MSKHKNPRESVGTSGGFLSWLFGENKNEELFPMKKDKSYWDVKHPKCDQMYAGRPIPGTNHPIEWDVRRFVWENDLVLSNIVQTNKLKNNDIDISAHNCQKWVVENIKYVSDDKLGCSEFWLLPTETLQLRRGDCEDGALLLSSLLLNCLPPEERWRVRVSAGWVKASETAPEGGHAYCCYCRTSDNEFVALDWCYMEDSDVKVVDKKRICDISWYKNVWFSFNHESAWSHISFAMRGRVKHV